MCGVFGFVSQDGKLVNLKTLARIAEVTERRGPHAFGFAWIDRKGRLKCFKQTGRISDHLGLLAMAADARLLIGHCRYATQGSPEQNINNHPHPADGGWIVHNGRIPNYDRLVDRNNLYPSSDCDTEVLGLLIEQGQGNLLDRCRRAVAAVRDREDEEENLFPVMQPLVLLGLWPRPDRLVAVRRGNPLHYSRTERGYYLASLAEGLPGQAARLKDDTACLFTKKEIIHAAV
jgi:glucosamine 6-phosphate synthetase-like amidotransferase/phosphosugar isomerase protein